MVLALMWNFYAIVLYFQLPEISWCREHMFGTVAKVTRLSRTHTVFLEGGHVVGSVRTRALLVCLGAGRLPCPVVWLSRLSVSCALITQLMT